MMGCSKTPLYSPFFAEKGGGMGHHGNHGSPPVDSRPRIVARGRPSENDGSSPFSPRLHLNLVAEKALTQAL